MDKLSERMRKNKVDITWSVSRTLATIDMWADKVAQLEALLKWASAEIDAVGNVDDFSTELLVALDEALKAGEE